MAAATTQTLNHHISRATKPPRPKLACFSFAAYAKTVVDHLISLDIPVLPGLSDSEFAAVESAFSFHFPPDLRSILQEGLPIGPGFPNWRSSSFQQLHILLNLPKFSLLKQVSLRNFWSDSWGPEPDDPNEAVALAKNFLDGVPVLVPIYKNCYVPSTPNMAGNPVFYVHGGEIRVLSFDLAGFFQNGEYSGPGESNRSGIHLPAWAAREARAVEFWTEASERGRKGAARGKTRSWWNDGDVELGLEGCLEEVFWKLRRGGWTEEEVREMMMMMDGQDEESGPTIEIERIGEVLLGAGWSRKDVAYSIDVEENSSIGSWEEEEESTFEINLQQPMRVSQVECRENGSRMNQLMQLHHGHEFLYIPTHHNLIL